MLKSSTRGAALAGLLLAVACCVANSLRAGDWPQILGPHRNGVAEDEKLAAAWPAGGPKVVWQRQVGTGFAGPAVVKGKLYLFHRVGKEETFECLDAASGKPLWKVAFAASYVSSISPDDGPRCVPLVHEDRVYLFGAAGNLHCVSADGKKLWSRAMLAEFGAQEGYFGAGSSPLVAGDKLLVNVGGRSGAGIVALALDSGKTVWQSTGEQASYSSPVLAEIAGKKQVVFVTRYTALGIDPESGKVLWRLPFGMRGPTVNAANPVVLGDRFFLTASYGVGAVFGQIGDGSQPKIEWQSNNVLSSQYTTPIAIGKHLYGVDGRDDVGVAAMRCIDPAGGKVTWRKEGFGKASLLAADGKLLAMKTSGELALVEASPAGYRELAAARVLDQKTYALPALSGGLFYVRDARTLKCLDLRP
ncbi:MAG: PQQ-like beta-propeller repeat protein [Planctomycetia bacterium]|nr:PQQ-like beta-propeller repeat protein [Planctomycetia bacterium]